MSQPDARLDALPAALALEVDALCDDFERHWRRSRRRGTPSPLIEAFVARAAVVARSALCRCLTELEHELRAGVALPEVPGFLLEEEIGRGGMGVVYRARRLEDDRVVALKLIPGAEHARWSRWLAELADLRHPNLVPLEAFGTYDGLHFVVMPLVSGGDLKERIAEFVIGSDGGPADLCGAAGLAARVAAAVAFLHGRGILHRDLKPSNILLSADREPLVCDFGLAGRLGEETRSGVIGTPPYAAPEQMEGRPLTAAADVWSMGAVLYELLTGKPPAGADPTPPRRWNAAVDETLERICLRCLGRDATARYPAAEALANDLNHYLEDMR